MKAKPVPTLLSVKQFTAKHPAFSEGSLRWQIFLSKTRETTRGTIPGNGLDRALLRVGRRVLICEETFFDWLREQDDDKASAA